MAHSQRLLVLQMMQTMLQALASGRASVQFTTTTIGPDGAVDTQMGGNIPGGAHIPVGHTASLWHMCMIGLHWGGRHSGLGLPRRLPLALAVLGESLVRK